MHFENTMGSNEGNVMDTVPDHQNYVQYSYESLERYNRRNETSEFCRSGKINFDLPSCGIKKCDKQAQRKTRKSTRIVPALNFVSNHVYNPQIQMEILNKNKNRIV